MGLVSAFKNADDPPAPEHTGATMRFKLVWRHLGEKAEVTEHYEKETSNPELWCKQTIEWFNATLRPKERKRVFVRCEVVGEVPPGEHKWFKATAMTQTLSQARGGMPYDKMQCERCGITGKRFGIGSHVHLDSKYKRIKAFQRCDTAMEKLGITPGGKDWPKPIR